MKKRQLLEQFFGGSEWAHFSLLRVLFRNAVTIGVLGEDIKRIYFTVL